MTTDLTAPSTALDTVDRPTVIAERMPVKTGQGGLSLDTLPQVVEFAKLLSQSQQGVPKPFRGQPGLCLAVTSQALRWGFDPFGVAQNAYVVNDKVAYEAKIVKAAIDQNAPLAEPLDYVFSGDGPTRTCKVIGKILTAHGEIVERTYETVPFERITPKNSPLWKTDPDQQLVYFATRAWARRHTPGVLLGVFSKDEMLDAGSTINGRGEETRATRERFSHTERMRQQRLEQRRYVEDAPEGADGGAAPEDQPVRDVNEDIETGEGAAPRAETPQEGAVENPPESPTPAANPAPSAPAEAARSPEVAKADTGAEKSAEPSEPPEDSAPVSEPAPKPRPDPRAEEAKAFYHGAMQRLARAKGDRAALLRTIQDEPGWFLLTDSQAQALEAAAKGSS